MRTAVLVDGAFYLRRHQTYFGTDRAADPERVAKDLWTHCIKHMDQKEGEKLYRIFFYDCPPLEKKLLHPKTNQLSRLGKIPYCRIPPGPS